LADERPVEPDSGLEGKAHDSLSGELESLVEAVHLGELTDQRGPGPPQVGPRVTTLAQRRQQLLGIERGAGVLSPGEQSFAGGDLTDELSTDECEHVATLLGGAADSDELRDGGLGIDRELDRAPAG